MGGAIFCSIQAFNWLGEVAHIREGTLLHLESTNLDVNFIQQHPHRNTQKSGWPSIWAPWPSQDAKNKHHIPPPPPASSDFTMVTEMNRGGESKISFKNRRI